jgi:hypothetical protein
MIGVPAAPVAGPVLKEKLKMAKIHPVATIRLDTDLNRVYISGPRGAASVRGDDPVEVGLHVLECLTGNKVAPPVSYRKGEPE